MCRSLWVSPLVALHWLTYIPMQTIKPTPAFLFFLKQREQVPIHWFNFPVPETTRARNWTRQALHLGCRLTDCSIEGSRKWAGLLPLLPHYSAVIWVTINICSVTFLLWLLLPPFKLPFTGYWVNFLDFPNWCHPTSLLCLYSDGFCPIYVIHFSPYRNKSWKSKQLPLASISVLEATRYQILYTHTPQKFLCV